MQYIINTVIQPNQSFHPRFLRGIENNNCILRIATSNNIEYKEFLYESWYKLFEQFKKEDSQNSCFIALQNDLILPEDTIYCFIQEYLNSKYHLLLYSNVDNIYNLDQPINDAFFIASPCTIHLVPFAKTKTCPLCEWIRNIIKAGYRVSYYCNKRLDIAPPKIISS